MAKRTPITLFEIPCESFGDPDLNECENCLLWAACVRYEDTKLKPDMRRQGYIRFDEYNKAINER